MAMRRLLVIVGALVWAGGCTQGGAQPEPAKTSAPAKEAAPTKQATADAPPTKATPEDKGSAGHPVFSHLSNPTPPPESTICAPLPEGADSTLRTIAIAARRLACEPALFYKPVAELRTELGIKDGMTLEFTGPASVSIKIPDPPKASEFATLIGVESPVAHNSGRGAWARRMWNLGSNADTGALDIWGPGVARFRVSVDYSSLDNSIMTTPLKDEELGRYVYISMPASVLPIQDDPAAVAELIAGLTALSKDRALLSKKPEEAAKAANLDGERFRVSARTVSGVQTEIDVWTRRTQIGGAAIVKALGLTGTIEGRRARDANDYLLYGAGGPQASSHKWNELSLELSFGRRDGGGEGLDAYVLSGISVG